MLRTDPIAYFSCRLLMQFGADARMLTSDGLTALDLCENSTAGGMRVSGMCIRR